MLETPPSVQPGLHEEALGGDGGGAVDLGLDLEALAAGPEAVGGEVRGEAGRDSEELEGAGDVGREGERLEDRLVLVAGVERDEEELGDGAGADAGREGVEADRARLAVGEDAAGDEVAVRVGAVFLPGGGEGPIERRGELLLPGVLLLLGRGGPAAIPFGGLRGRGFGRTRAREGAGGGRLREGGGGEQGQGGGKGGFHARGVYHTPPPRGKPAAFPPGAYFFVEFFRGFG